MSLDTDWKRADIEDFLDKWAADWETNFEQGGWVEYRVQTTIPDDFEKEAEYLVRQIGIKMEKIDWDYDEDNWGMRTYYGLVAFNID